MEGCALLRFLWPSPSEILNPPLGTTNRNFFNLIHFGCMASLLDGYFGLGTCCQNRRHGFYNTKMALICC